MEKLTKKSESGMVWFIDRENDDMELEPCEMSAHHSRLAIQKLAEYEYSEEQGLLLRLPCKVGDTIYVNGILGVGESEEYKVIRVDYHSNLSTNRSEFYIEALLESDPRNSIGFYDKEFGKTVFITREEAEQKLKEMESD